MNWRALSFQRTSILNSRMENNMAKDLLIVLLLAGIGFLTFFNISAKMQDVYSEGISTGYNAGINQCPDVEYRQS